MSKSARYILNLIVVAHTISFYCLPCYADMEVLYKPFMEVYEKGSNVEFYDAEYYDDKAFYFVYGVYNSKSINRDLYVMGVSINDKSKAVPTKILSYDDSQKIGGISITKLNSGHLLILEVINKDHILYIEFDPSSNKAKIDEIDVAKLDKDMTDLSAKQILAISDGSFLLSASSRGKSFIIDYNKTKGIIWKFGVFGESIKDLVTVSEISKMNEHTILVVGAVPDNKQGSVSTWIGIVEAGILKKQKIVSDVFPLAITSSRKRLLISVSNMIQNKIYIFDESLNMKSELITNTTLIFGKKSRVFVCDNIFLEGGQMTTENNGSTLLLTAFEDGKKLKQFNQKIDNKQDYLKVFKEISIIDNNQDAIVASTVSKMDKSGAFFNSIELSVFRFINLCELPKSTK